VWIFGFGGFLCYFGVLWWFVGLLVCWDFGCIGEVVVFWDLVMLGDFGCFGSFWVCGGFGGLGGWKYWSTCLS
jgi:hypothetical protein